MSVQFVSGNFVPSSCQFMFGNFGFSKVRVSSCQNSLLARADPNREHPWKARAADATPEGTPDASAAAGAAASALEKKPDVPPSGSTRDSSELFGHAVSDLLAGMEQDSDDELSTLVSLSG